MRRCGAILGLVILVSACVTSQEPGSDFSGKLMGRWEGVWTNPKTRKSDTYRLIFRPDSTMDYTVNGRKAFSGPFRTMGDTMLLWHGDSVYYDLQGNTELWLRPPKKFNDTIWPIYEIYFYR